MKQFKFIFLALALIFSLTTKSQTDDSKAVDNYFELVNYYSRLQPSKEAKFSPYVEAKYSFIQNFTTWKKENKFLYIKEIWYHAESFSIERNHFSEGVSMDESMIDVSRFEKYRKETETSTVTIEGFKDAIILLPSNKLIYKP